MGTAVLLAASAWAGHRALKHRGHPGLPAFIAQWARNYPGSFAMDPVVIRIEVDDQAMERLKAVVERARDRGVIMPDGNQLVEARCEAGGRTFKARIRIKGKLADHVQGRKWSFRVIARKDGGFLGMKRFSLQHPGTRNYLYDWFYHQLSRMEGIIALRYGFCKVIFNGEDLGIYAYEEHFGPALLENNRRLEGPILRFDPDLYWVHRLNKLEGRAFDEAYAEYQAAAVDAYGTNDMLKDPEAVHQFQQALALLDGFRRGTLTASQVFDVDRMARRHAILDLIGGHHSMDWSDVKYHYDPVAQRLEPVSYESFSAFPTRKLAGAYRFTGAKGASPDLHGALFNDTALFRAYVHHLERMSRKPWLDSIFAAIAPALDTASATMYREFPYKELDRSIYYRNQDVIRRMLDVPLGFHAYLQGHDHDTLTLALVPVNSLPVEVTGLVVGSDTIAPAAPVIVPSRPRGGMAGPVEVRFAVPDSLKITEPVVACRVLGATPVKAVSVRPFALPGSEMRGELLALKPPNLAEFDFLDVDEAERVIRCKPGRWTIDRDLVVPAGYRLVVTGGTTLQLENGAWIISRSPLDLRGTDPDEGAIEIIDGSGRGGVKVLEAPSVSRFRSVRGGRFILYRSKARFEHGRATSVRIDLGTAELDHVELEGGDGGDLMVASHATVSLSHCLFHGGKDDGLVLNGGEATLNEVTFDGVAGVAVKAGEGAVLSLLRCSIAGSEKGVELREGAHMTWEEGALLGNAVGVEADKDAMRYGPVRAELLRVEVKGNRHDLISGQGSTIMRDGKRLGVSKSAKGT